MFFLPIPHAILHLTPVILATIDHAIGGVLSQIQDGQEKVIAYWSRQLQKPERNYSTIEREALAVVSAVKEFYPYLYGFQFKLLLPHIILRTAKIIIRETALIKNHGMISSLCH